MEEFTAKWFAIYYLVLGLLLLITGSGLIIKNKACKRYLISQSATEHAPAIIRTILKYFFLFTLPCLVFSFIPFSWPELLFSVWSLLMVYTCGIQLVRWSTIRQKIKNQADQISQLIKRTGAMMLALCPIMFLLAYFVILRFPKQ